MPKYAKVFDSIWEGSLRGETDPLLVFINLLTHSDEEGVVDRHWKPIADETGLSGERVCEALLFLEAPDDDSRTPTERGRRIVRLNEQRTWGWRIVNHGKYRELCSKSQNAERQARFRERQNSNAPVTRSVTAPVGVGVTASVSSSQGIVKGGLLEVASLPPTQEEYIFTRYNEVAAKMGFPKVTVLNTSRKRSIAARLKEYPHKPEWDAMFAMLEKSPALVNGWFSFDWLVKSIEHFDSVARGWKGIQSKPQKAVGDGRYYETDGIVTARLKTQARDAKTGRLWSEIEAERNEQ